MSCHCSFFKYKSFKTWTTKNDLLIDFFTLTYELKIDLLTEAYYQADPKVIEIYGVAAMIEVLLR